MYHTALSMLNGLNAAERANAPLLFRMLAELEFDLDRLEVALNILLSMAEDVPRREYLFLKTKKKAQVTILGTANTHF